MPTYDYRVYYYIDGVETATGLDWRDDFDGQITNEGVGDSDSAAAQTHHVEIDTYTIGYTNYGTDEIFGDTFGGTGFLLWDTYVPGSPGTYLTETGGSAVLDVPGVASIGSPQILKDVPLPTYRNMYWRLRIKCTSPATHLLTSPPTTFAFDADNEPASQYRIAATEVQFGHTGNNPVSGFQSFTDDIAIDLDDGNWHTIGFRWEILDLPLPSVDVAINHTFGLGD